MRLVFLLTLLVIIIGLRLSASANALICETHSDCNDDSSSSSNASTAEPNRGTLIRMNPSAIPIEKGLGLEAIYYKGSADFAFVKGLGRVGAALSPSNSEQTFFGPPGFELPETFLQRNQTQGKYEAPKYTLGTSFNVYKNHVSKGWKHFEVNLGVMAKYNADTSIITPGAGLSGVAGPFTFGFSTYNDDTQYSYGLYGLTTQPLIYYLVQTYSLGLFFDHFVFDYSYLRVISDSVSTVSVLTATALLDKFILVAAYRVENSDRPAYDLSTRALVNQQTKIAEFGGVQYHVTDIFMLGVFYNYYLVREFSAGATLFF